LQAQGHSKRSKHNHFVLVNDSSREWQLCFYACFSMRYAYMRVAEALSYDMSGVPILVHVTVNACFNIALELVLQFFCQVCQKISVVG
jgi:hypothetical protein